MFTNPRRQTLMTKVTNDDPKLQRAKAATELDAVIRSAAHLVLFRRTQIFRQQRKCAAQQIEMPAIKHREIERREEPFVWIEHHRIRPVATLKNVTHLGNNRG